MKGFSREQWLAGITGLLIVILTITAGFAATDARLQSLVHPSEYALGIAAVLFIIASILAVRTIRRRLPPLEKSKLDRLRGIVHEAEVSLGADPELKETEELTDKLTSWEEVSRELVTMSIVQDEKNDEEYTILSEGAAKLLLRLMHAITPAMTQQGDEHQKTLIELANPTYKVGTKLKEWAEAARIAYYGAHTYYDLNLNLSLKQGEEWVNRMKGCLKHLHMQPPDNQDLLLMLSEVKGLLFRDYEGKLEEARKSFEDALEIAQKIDSTKMIAKIFSHLGELEEMEGKLDAAGASYEKALTSALAVKDIDRVLYSYNRLGRLAFVSDRFDDAYQLYNKQFTLSASSPKFWHWESLAHEGIARICAKKAELLTKDPNPSVQDYQPTIATYQEEAYQHVRKALAIEENFSKTGPRINLLRERVIKMTDIILKPS